MSKCYIAVCNIGVKSANRYGTPGLRPLGLDFFRHGLDTLVARLAHSDYELVRPADWSTRLSIF
jgi:hypothetical protein